MSEKRDAVLVLNAGSSSLKVGLLDTRETTRVLASGQVERIDQEDASLEMTAGRARVQYGALGRVDHAGALRLALQAFGRVVPEWQPRLKAVGHRVVHGGALYIKPTLVTREVEQRLDELRELAPLHNGRAVAVMREALSLLPDIPQVACFDTAFHTNMPAEAALYALPRELSERFSIRRYGFHGLSCAWSMERLATLTGAVPSRTIVCHLGAGASVTAVRDGISVDTTMGLTPLEGLIMATRSGTIDPSIPLYLQRHAGMSADDVERLLEQESGLLGLSGTTGDVRTLEQEAGNGDRRAEDALSAFAYRVRSSIGAFMAVLGGLDVLVLTGGIGEHSASMRQRILSPLAPMGISIDVDANQAVGDEDRAISFGTERAVWVIHVREECVIARQTLETLDR